MQTEKAAQCVRNSSFLVVSLYASWLTVYLSLTWPELASAEWWLKTLCVFKENKCTHTHTKAVFLSEGQLCQKFLVSVPPSVIREGDSRECGSGRFVSFQSFDSNDSLEPRWHGSTMPEPHITALLPAGQWSAPGPRRGSQPAKVTARAGRGLRRRHVTHLQRLSPEKTCRQTPQPGARWAETFRERAV